jgi:3-deoxy-D-manno-octulosonic-acid transferase
MEAHTTMIWLYRILYLPLLLIMLPYYVRRMLKRGGYGRDFAHRFGAIKNIPIRSEKKRIWLHAVSVGELLAVEPLLKAIHDSGYEAVVTTTTSTAYTLLKDKFKSLCIAGAIFPLDFWPCQSMAFRRIQPDLIVLMEGELWPELLHRARRLNLPVILINARLSDRSYLRYLKCGALSRWLFNQPKHIGAASQLDLERFQTLGISRERLTHTGNLKLDKTPPPLLTTEEKNGWLQQFGFPTQPRPLIILGSSTWPGEEVALVQIAQLLRQNGIDNRVILVPRHAERRHEIEQELHALDIAFHLRSWKEASPQDCPVYVADTTGELTLITQLSDVVFIGKSLLFNRGGQSPVEAAALGKPLIFGPDMSNFRNIAEELVQSGAALQVANAEELHTQLRWLLTQPDKRENCSLQALNWHRKNTGATVRTLDLIRGIIAHP